MSKRHAGALFANVAFGERRKNQRQVYWNEHYCSYKELNSTTLDRWSIFGMGIENRLFYLNEGRDRCLRSYSFSFEVQKDY